MSLMYDFRCSAVSLKNGIAWEWPYPEVVTLPVFSISIGGQVGSGYKPLQNSQFHVSGSEYKTRVCHVWYITHSRAELKPLQNSEMHLHVYYSSEYKATVCHVSCITVTHYMYAVTWDKISKVTSVHVLYFVGPNLPAWLKGNCKTNHLKCRNLASNVLCFFCVLIWVLLLLLLLLFLAVKSF